MAVVLVGLMARAHALDKGRRRATKAYSVEVEAERAANSVCSFPQLKSDLSDFSI
jgi:hypothetical protein